MKHVVQPVTVALLPFFVTTLWTANVRAERCADGTRAKPEPRSENDNSPEASLGSAREECVERDIHFMPGLFATYMHPAASQGGFYGGGVQVMPYQWSHNNDRFGPSQGGIVLQAALLQPATGAGSLSLFEGGMTASFERNSSRRFLIPYFGGTIGALSQRDLGTALYAYPNGGVHVYHHRNLMLDAEGGYVFPFESIDALRGPRAQLALRFSLW